MSPKSGAITLVAIIAGTWGGTSFINLASRAREADHAEAREHRETCKKLRVAFLTGCGEEGVGRAQCLVAWSQVRGQVFDSPPEMLWADEVDCSVEAK